MCNLKWELMCMYIRTALILEPLRDSKETLTWTFEIVQNCFHSQTQITELIPHNFLSVLRTEYFWTGRKWSFYPLSFHSYCPGPVCSHNQRVKSVKWQERLSNPISNYSAVCRYLETLLQIPEVFNLEPHLHFTSMKR